MTVIKNSDKVGLGKAIGSYFSGYFNFIGRTSRKGFWWPLLLVLSIFLLLGIMVAGLATLASLVGLSSNGFILPLVLVFLGFLFPTLALFARRLRDVGVQEIYPWLVVAGLSLALLGHIWVSTGPGNGLSQWMDVLFYLLAFFLLVSVFIIAFLPSDYLKDGDIKA